MSAQSQACRSGELAHVMPTLLRACADTSVRLGVSAQSDLQGHLVDHFVRRERLDAACRHRVRVAGPGRAGPGERGDTVPKQRDASACPHKVIYNVRACK